ncbi:MAG TPA: hypothetical protein VFM45_09260 [Anaeromyxobacteraceae bacterium]|nr:hypothetical protein [Anaeromyxobacteraceae bacterium]
MRRWRLDAVLRIRTAAEERAAVAHGAAVAARVRSARAADEARAAWEVARGRAPSDTASVAAIQRAGEHLRRLDLDAGRAQVALGAALRTERASRDVLLRASRDRQVLSTVRERDERRSRRARESALEEDLMEHRGRRSSDRTSAVVDPP